MPAQSYPYLAFNRGLMSRLGLSRLDIARGRLSAEVMTNWMPRVLGSMMLRPGMKYLGAPKDGAITRLIPFVFSKSDRAMLEFTPNSMRIWINDALLMNPSTTTAITNGTFTGSITGWADNDESGAASSWVAPGYLRLQGDGTNAAIVDQTVTVSGANVNVEHALNIVVVNGPVLLRVGTGITDESYIAETSLATGTHHLRFTPSGNFNIRLMNRLLRYVYVDSVTLDNSGATTFVTPWQTADHLNRIRYDQSGDVMFLAMKDFSPYRVERRSARSWSVVKYLPEDGPFRVMNTTQITITPSAVISFGNIILTGSSPIFRQTHVGALYKLIIQGQNPVASVSAQNVFTESIRVSGIENERIFTVFVAEDVAGAATFTLQRSLESADGPWTDMFSWTANTLIPWDDSLDNVIAWYRLGVKTGYYTNGTHTCALYYALGTSTGIARVTEYVSSTVVNAETLKAFGVFAGSAGATTDWFEGEWSDARGWPSAVALHESRLCWAGKGKLWLSATDAFDVFDDEIEGDSAPISRSIGAGPVDNINWLISLERLLMGADGAEFSVRSSSLDEPLTPTAFQIKPASTQGSADVNVLGIDRRAVFVQAGATRVFETAIDNDESATDFGVLDLTQVIPEIGEPSLVRAAVQRQPDTRAHFIRSDGSAAVLIFDKVENTICWCEVTTGYPTADSIEDVCVLPTSGSVAEGPEDFVYYVVRRLINGSYVRTLEKWARESECHGGLLNKQADSHVVYDGAATQTITGLSHLNGANVVVWADGVDVGTATSTGTSWTQTYTVSGGQIVLPTAASKVVVGLPYKAQWKSSKLALAASLGMPLTKRKRVHGLGIVLADTHTQGLFFGRDFTHLDPLPLMRNEKVVDQNTVLADAEDGSMQFPGEWSTDSRICLEARAPRPCTACAIVADTEVHEQR